MTAESSPKLPTRAQLLQGLGRVRAPHSTDCKAEAPTAETRQISWNRAQNFVPGPS